MNTRSIALAALALTILMLLTASVAFAGGSTDGVIKDAADGTVDGSWSASQIKSALTSIKTNPVYSQYSDVEGVLQDYLASLAAPGAAGMNGGQLAFTGGSTFVVLALGLGLIGGGLLLRRRVRA